MARRSPSGDGMNLDSLLDTLTNVVGVLVMVLMLTTLNVKAAVERILDLDPTQLAISERDLDRTRQQAEELRQRRQALAAKVGSTTAVGTAGPGEDFGTLVQKLDELKTRQTALAPVPPDNDELLQRLAGAGDRSQSLAAQLLSIEEELARLKAQLDKTVPNTAPPPMLVKLPSPRDAPQGAVEYRVIVRDGRVTPFNPAVVRERCKKQVETLLKSPQLREKNGDIDCEKLVDTFNRRGSVVDQDFKIRLAVENFKLVVVFELRPSGGESAKEVGGTNSEFRRGLRALSKLHGDKYYLRFLVWSDSFDAYVAGRRVCDEMNVLAGWEPYQADYVWRENLGITVPCKGRPAPPPPPKTPPVPAPVGPPPPPLPNDVVD